MELYPILLLAISCISLIGLFFFKWKDYLSPYLISKKTTKSMPSNTKKEGISIVISCHNQAEYLEKNIPLLYQQDYHDFEIIVVDNSSTDHTDIVLQRLEKEYENFRHTFVPKSSRFISKKKLAITLGIKAARKPWVVLTEADCIPKNNLWLQTISSHFSPNTDLVIGYSAYTGNSNKTAKRFAFEQMQYLFHCMSYAARNKAFGGDGCNLCVRKKYFIDNKGYSNTFNTPLGEDDLLISYLTKKGNTSVCVHPQSIILQELDNQLTYKNKSIHKVEVAKHYNKHGKLFLAKKTLSNISSSILTISTLAYLYVRCKELVDNNGTYNLSCLYFDITFLLVLLLYIISPIICIRMSTNKLKERPYGLSIVYYELTQPYKDLANKLRWWKSRKEFVRR